MENLINNKFLLLTYIALAINFAVSAFMLTNDPIIITTEKIYSIAGEAGAISCGPIIVVKENHKDDYEYLRHEYQHYCNQAVLTPIGHFMIYVFGAFEGFVRYGNWKMAYVNNPLERDAFDKQNDGIEFEVFDWNLKQKKTITNGR